jgi:uncharacterized membrane protein HdeD (DUF308 family)
MVDFTLYSNNKEFLEKFKKYSTIIGIVFILLGIAGIVYPTIMSVVTAIFYGWLLLFSSIMISVHTWSTNRGDWLGWLKALLLFLVGALIVVNPLPGVAALGILLTIYFFMDAFTSVALAFNVKPENRWWLILLNGILSLFLGIYLLIGWPFSSLFLVGLFVGISLFFDGVILLSMSKSAKDISDRL